MLSRVERRGNFRGFQIVNSNIVVSHSQYVDDAIIFCDADETQLRNIVRYLEICEVVMGIKVNLHKSSLVRIKCRGPALQSLALVLGCKVKTFLITYLGLPISDSKFPITVWDKIIESVQVKLDLWKYKYLSLGYSLTIMFSQSSCVSDVGDSYGTHGENNKYHLLRWDRVYTPKREGGLGIRRLRYFNAALLCKWWWRSYHFRSHLWCQVLIAKYGLESYNVWIGGGRGRESSYMWRAIGGGRGRESSYMWRAIYNYRPMISGYFRWNLGSGRQILLWHHKWLGDYPLKVAFPDVFRLASNQNILVCNAVQIFVWLASQNKILTIDNLLKRSKILPNSYLLCKQDGESVNHLLLHCPFVSMLWSWLQNMVGVSLPLPQDVLGIVHHFTPLFLPIVGRAIWKIVIGSIMWEVWKERNRRTFEGTVLNLDKVIHLVELSIWSSISVSKEGWGI
ncbi:hypothetical protein AMTRI_Chr03g51160 [Amborella trichopoda]